MRAKDRNAPAISWDQAAAQPPIFRPRRDSLLVPPHTAQDPLGLGQCEWRLKDYPRVEKLEAALRLDPTRLLAHFYLSRAFTGNTADAAHESALHQLMMQQSTLLDRKKVISAKLPIKAQVEQLLAGHREEEALRVYEEHFKGTAANRPMPMYLPGSLSVHENGRRIALLASGTEETDSFEGRHTNEGILALKLGDLKRAESEFNAELVNDRVRKRRSPRLAKSATARSGGRLRRNWQDRKPLLPELLLVSDSYFHPAKWRMLT